MTYPLMLIVPINVSINKHVYGRIVGIDFGTQRSNVCFVCLLCTVKTLHFGDRGKIWLPSYRRDLTRETLLYGCANMSVVQLQMGGQTKKNWQNYQHFFAVTLLLTIFCLKMSRRTHMII